MGFRVDHRHLSESGASIWLIGPVKAFTLYSNSDIMPQSVAMVQQQQQQQSDPPKLKNFQLSQLISNELSHQNSIKSTIKLVGMDISSISDEDVKLLLDVERLSLRKNRLISLPPNFSQLQKLASLSRST